MKVIVASFSKCGTKTMAAALRQLGLVVYDFLENYEFLGRHWNEILEHGGSPELFRRMYEGVDAVTDVPCCLFWEELLQAFPEAKIIYSERVTEDEWVRSIRHQHDELLKMMKPAMLLSHTARDFKYYLDKMSCTGYGQTHFNEMQARKAYRLHNSYIRMNAPKDQLLKIDFRDGWPPLCDFLGVPMPPSHQRFPHKNKAASLTSYKPKPNEEAACNSNLRTTYNIQRDVNISICLMSTIVVACFVFFTLSV